MNNSAITEPHQDPAICHLERLKALPAILEKAGAGAPAPYDMACLLATFGRAQESLSVDLAALRDLGIEQAVRSPLEGRFTDICVEAIENWDQPSLLAFVCLACDIFGLDRQSPPAIAALIAAVLGDVENGQAFHGNAHNRKVLTQILGLIAAHNALCEEQEGEPPLSPEDIALQIAAACIHDLGHDGRGNSIDGTHIPFRLEKISCDLGRAGLAAAGLDQAQIDRVRAIILCTDVTADAAAKGTAGGISPVAALKAHYLGQEDVSLPQELSLLERDPQLMLMGLLMHTADIAISAGLSLGRLRAESAFLAEETGVESFATPAGYSAFLDFLGENILLTEAGKALYSKSLEKIRHEISTLA